MATGLGIIRAPEPRQLEEQRDESSVVTQVLDIDMSRIVAPLADYIPLIAEVQSKTSDQICLELAAECDRLRVLIDVSEHHGKKMRPGETSAIVARRLSALKLLAQRLDDVSEKEEVRIELATISSVVSMVRDVLRETGVAQETREIVFQKLLSRLSAQREAVS
jgi:hypothetical protein